MTKQELQEKLSLFAANTQKMKDEFKWREAVTRRLAALLYTFENKPVDGNAIRESHTMIKASTGVFSTFRGHMALCVAAMLSLKDNREALFAGTKTIYERMKSAQFHASDYLVVASYQIAANANADAYEQTITRARAFYDGMKANGFFRTGEDDYIFAAMLGLSDIDVKAGTERIERLYRRLKPDFRSGNSVQALAQILVLGGESEAAVTRLYALRDDLKNKELRLDTTFTSSCLGILALLPVDIGTVARDIEDAAAFLKAQKGFGAFSVTTQERQLLAAATVASIYAEDVKNGALTASVSTSMTGILISAQQAAMIAAISASNAAASSSQ